MDNTHHKNISIETRTGRTFSYFADTVDDITIEDIASALSKLCRFVGHCRTYYSVAEHSIYVSYLVRPEMQLAGLLHDASEAYFADMASPIKKQMPEYHKIEAHIMGRIGRKFGLPEKFWEAPEIKQADMMMLRTEAFQLFESKGAGWGIPDDIKMAPVQILADPPKMVEQGFLERYHELLELAHGHSGSNRIILQ